MVPTLLSQKDNIAWYNEIYPNDPKTSHDFENDPPAKWLALPHRLKMTSPKSNRQRNCVQASNKNEFLYFSRSHRLKDTYFTSPLWE